MKSKYLIYRDDIITIFDDYERLTCVFLNDLGKTKAISYDDNFFYVEYMVDTYYEFLEDSFKGWKGKELDEADKQEMKTYLEAFIKDMKNHNELDEEAYSKEVRGLLGL